MTTIEQLNRDFDAFYDFCKENNLTDDDIKQLCQPLLTTIWKTKLVKQLKIGLLAVLLILILYSICNTETIAWHLSAIGRILMIKLLPFYDWSQLRNEICIIKRINTEITNSVNNCVLCEAIDEIVEFDGFNPDAIYEDYIKLHIPVKLKNVDLEWEIQSLPVINLTETLLTNQILSTSFPCKLSTNLFKHSQQQFHDILMRAANANQRYFIHFQNCEWDAVKQFRIYTPRPPFLYREIAPIQYSWLLLNRNYKIDKFKRIDLQDNIAVIVQIFGATNFRLLPQRRCESECFVMEDVLREGDVLILTSLWDLEYKPMADGENIAVILETH